MSDIEKSPKDLAEESPAKTVPNESPQQAAHFAAQLSELVAKAQIEWQMADSGIDFSPEERHISDIPAAELPSRDVAGSDPTSVDPMEPQEFEFTDLEAVVSEASAEEAPQVSMADEVAVLDEDDNINPDEPVEFVEADQAISIIESLLFASDKPVSVGTFKQIFKGTNIRTKDISRALNTLASEYASGRRGVTLEEIHGGYQLRTKVDNADYLKRLAKTRPFKLSGPALETLAIVAYKQPTIKSEIDEIRGVESGHLMRALMERGLISFAGKSDLPGKPMQYGTTRKFLEIFGLRNLKELPTLSEIDELLPDGIGDEEVTDKKETLSDISGDLSVNASGTYSEGEEELLKITDQLQSINTSSEFFQQEKDRQRDKRDHERAQDIREAITVGEKVEDKDQKWLARYESKLQAAALAAEAALNRGSPSVSADCLPPVDQEASEADASAGLELGDLELTDEDYADDLDANMNWNEDSEI